MARLPVNRLRTMFQETAMLLSAPPLLQTLRVKRLDVTSTARPWYCESTRTAPPPRSGPSLSQRLPVKVERRMRSRPPRVEDFGRRTQRDRDGFRTTGEADVAAGADGRDDRGQRATARRAVAHDSCGGRAASQRQRAHARRRHPSERPHRSTS
jgi:hypothetical protein